MNLCIDPNPVVVVPVHRLHPTDDEQFSLKRCGNLLGCHPIFIVHPHGLNLEPYFDLLPTATPLPVPAEWMASIRAYNRMMINPAFYAMFERFSHLLVHEPDALVISDQLLYWCEKPFDYIGAPWFEGFHAAPPDAPIIGVGNSGFCLINISAIRSLLDSSQRWISRKFILNELSRKLLGRTSRFSFDFLFRAFGKAGTMGGAHRLVATNCDTFLSNHASVCNLNSFRIADPLSAILFSWEVNPQSCFRLCGRSLPFGVHAWARYDPTFILNLLRLMSE